MERNTRWSLLAIVSISIGGAVWWNSSHTARSTTQKIDRHARVEYRDIVSTITGTGSVTPETRVEIKPPISGRIESILVDEGAVVSKGQIIAWMSSTDRAVLLDSARAKSREEEKKWESIIKPAPIVAPMSGTIISRPVEPGQTVAANDVLMVVSDRLKIQAQIDETDVGKIRLGMRAEFELDAFPNRRVKGRVTKIGYESKVVNNVTVYVVDVTPEQVVNDMRAGMTAYVFFESSAVKHQLAISNDAIHTVRGKSTVSIQTASGAIKTVDVTTGLTDGEYTQLMSGVTPSDDVVIIDRATMRRGHNSSPLNPASGRGRRAQ